MSGWSIRERAKLRGLCAHCHAPAGHPEAVCPLCGLRTTHVQGSAQHFRGIHADVAKTPRARSLLVDVVRAQVRGWPVAPRIEACRAAGLLA